MATRCNARPARRRKRARRWFRIACTGHAPRGVRDGAGGGQRGAGQGYGRRTDAGNPPSRSSACAGRYPQARSADELWARLVARRGLRDADSGRALGRRARLRRTQGRSRARATPSGAGFCPAWTSFDPLFFGLSPREAQYTDPQQRLFLETVWNLFESSGYTRGRIARAMRAARSALYVGSMYSQYDGLQERAPSRPVLQSMQERHREPRVALLRADRPERRDRYDVLVRDRRVASGLRRSAPRRLRACDRRRREPDGRRARGS